MLKMNKEMMNPAGGYIYIKGRSNPFETFLLKLELKIKRIINGVAK